MPSGLTADGQSLTDGLEKEEISQLLTLLAQDAQVHHQLEPVKPDIIGEYLVLDYINQKSLSVKCKQFIAACWEKRDEFLAFLSRCVRSYLRDFSGLIFGEHPILFAEADPWAQAIIMFGMTTLPDITFCQKAINVLESLYNQYQEPSFALVYASGLVNLSAKLDVNEAAETIERLKSIAEHWPDNQEIALRYALGLFNLSAKQDVNEAEKTIDKLKTFSDNWPNSQEIVQVYTMAQFYFSRKQAIKNIISYQSSRD